MAADRRGRDADPRRERPGGQRRPAQQLLEHPRAGPVGERGGDVGEIGHALQRRPATFRCATEASRAYRRPHAAGRPRLHRPAAGPRRARSARWPGCAPPSPASRRARPTPAAARSSRRCSPNSTPRSCATPRQSPRARGRGERRSAPPHAAPPHAAPPYAAPPHAAPPHADAPLHPRRGARRGARRRSRRRPRRRRRGAGRRRGVSPRHRRARRRRRPRAPARAAPARRARGRRAAGRAARPGVRGDRGARPRRAHPAAREVLRERRPCPRPAGSAPTGGSSSIDLAGHPFGAGPRACPGEAHARALAAGVVEGAR